MRRTPGKSTDRELPEEAVDRASAEAELFVEVAPRHEVRQAVEGWAAVGHGYQWISGSSSSSRSRSAH